MQNKAFETTRTRFDAEVRERAQVAIALHGLLRIEAAEDVHALRAPN
jgi:hypothetical protein